MLKRITFVLFLFSILLTNQVSASSGSIDASHHYAWGENIGWIVFGTGDNKVMTDWRPATRGLLLK